jgi:hypothetical protein
MVSDGTYTEVLAKFLHIQVDDIHVWSDGSMTVGDADRIDYMVSEDEIEYGERIGKLNGFFIHQLVQWEE